MRYSVVAAAVIGAASAAMEGGGVSQLPDGQPQAPTSSIVNPVISSTEQSPVQETTPAVDQTVYQTQTYTITSCAPEVVSCPATTATSVIPYVSGTPVSQTDNSPVGQSSAPVQSPAPSSAPAVSEIPMPSGPVPVITDNSPLGGGSATVCPTTCPAAVTSYITVTVAPSGAPSTPSGESTPGQGSGSGTPGSSGSNSPTEGGAGNGNVGSNTPAQGESTPGSSGSNSPTEGGSNSGNNGGAAAPSGSAPISSVVDNSPIQPPYATGPAVSTAQGTGAVGTASTGGVFPGPTNPTVPFLGAASTLSGSFVAAGLAAMAAIFFV